MKQPLRRIFYGTLILILGFFAGRIFQHQRSGYNFEVRDEKNYESPFGLIRWRYVTESFGMPLLDPGTTMIEFDHRTIYKSQRSFQQAGPFARNIQSTGNSIQWDDGDYRFHLNLEKLPDENKKQ